MGPNKVDGRSNIQRRTFINPIQKVFLFVGIVVLLGLGSALLWVLRNCNNLPDTPNIADVKSSPTSNPPKSSFPDMDIFKNIPKTPTLSRNLKTEEKNEGTFNDLSDFFKSLEDTSNQPRVVDFVDPKGLSIRKYICPNKEGRTTFVEISYYGELVGYKSIGNSEYSFVHFPGHLQKAVVNNSGDIIGFMQENSFMSARIPFFTLSGKIGKAYKDEGLTGAETNEGLIFEDNSPFPLGRLNPSDDQFVDQDGKVIGKLDKNAEYLEFESAPSCGYEFSQSGRKLFRFHTPDSKTTNLGDIKSFIDTIITLSRQQPNFWKEE